MSNRLINAARVAHGEYFKDFIYRPSQIGPVQYRVIPSRGEKGFEGVFDPLMGGVQPRVPPRTGQSAAKFAAILMAGETSPVWQELLFDARRYKLSGNPRMAVANLVMSFEIGLSVLLSRIAQHRGDTSLQAQIEQASIGRLVQQYSSETLGHSLEKVSFWGADTVRRCNLLRETRNKVLHRAQLSVSVDDVTWDFSDSTVLERLFQEYDRLWDTLTDSVKNVLSGRSAV